MGSACTKGAGVAEQVADAVSSGAEYAGKVQKTLDLFGQGGQAVVDKIVSIGEHTAIVSPLFKLIGGCCEVAKQCKEVPKEAQEFLNSIMK